MDNGSELIKDLDVLALARLIWPKERLKKFRAFTDGSKIASDVLNKSSVYREPGRVEKDMDNTPSFWNSKALPFAKTVFWFTLGAAVVVGVINGTAIGCVYSDKLDIQNKAAQLKNAETQANLPCLDLVEISHQSTDVTCPHVNHVIKASKDDSWFIIQCTCADHSDEGK